MKRDQISMMVLLLLMPLAALAFVKTGPGSGTCDNGNTVGNVSLFVLNTPSCFECINDPDDVYDPGFADCRNCCIKLVAAPPSGAFDHCRVSNGC